MRHGAKWLARLVLNERLRSCGAIVVAGGWGGRLARRGYALFCERDARATLACRKFLSGCLGVVVCCSTSFTMASPTSQPGRPHPSEKRMVDAERERVRGLTTMLTDALQLDGACRPTLIVCRHLEEIARFHTEMVSRLSSRAAETPADHGRVIDELHALGRALEKFQAAARQFAQSAAADVERRLRAVVSEAERAAEQRNTQAYLKLLPAALDEIADLLRVLSALRGADDEPVARLRELHANCAARVRSLEAGLRDEIIRDNVPPEDRYRGSDRQTLLDNFRNVWVQNYPDSEVLGVRISSADWEHVQGWSWAAGRHVWRRFDYFEIEAVIAVQADAEHVELHELACIRQPEAGGERRRYRIRSTGPLAPRQIVLLTNWE